MCGACEEGEKLAYVEVLLRVKLRHQHSQVDDVCNPLPLRGSHQVSEGTLSRALVCHQGKDLVHNLGIAWRYISEGAQDLEVAGDD